MLGHELEVRINMRCLASESCSRFSCARQFMRGEVLSYGRRISIKLLLKSEFNNDDALSVRGMVITNWHLASEGPAYRINTAPPRPPSDGATSGDNASLRPLGEKHCVKFPYILVYDCIIFSYGGPPRAGSRGRWENKTGVNQLTIYVLTKFTFITKT
ncbi:hypothetical protein E2C01_025395 [Portunus trituberculatus]|uniref:Uncharacterized protein n=1 Tax=Portunus trituberculatus TaxID=210409 RepID=A0A5B7ED68_PORTR|nr:hypothetical protein [Portunus trituberculatus]